MLTIYYKGRKKEIYDQIKQELESNPYFKEELLNNYFDELEELGMDSEEYINSMPEKINKVLLNSVKKDIKICFENCYNSKNSLKGHSQYCGPVRLADHGNISSTSSRYIDINIIWE